MFPIIPRQVSQNSCRNIVLGVEQDFPRIFDRRVPLISENLPRANGHIPANARTTVWFADDLKEVDDEIPRVPLLVHHKDDRLQSFPLDQNAMWAKYLPIAADIQSQNMILEIVKEENRFGLVVRCVKNINDGDEIQMWFAEEISALISMPFLTPRNISEQNLYVCHICGKQYEHPNPLKLHISQNCGIVSPSCIWKTVREMLLQLNCQTIVPLNLSKKISTNVNELIPNINEQIPKRKSAFVPYPIQKCEETAETLSRYPAFLPPQRASYNTEATALSIQVQNQISEANFRAHASQMEAIVSNLGKSNKGHLCIYCGKIYSRKYGLKIHIRTHTGFKPLKCKYCSRAFGDPSNLNKHVRLHLQGESPYRCDICNKVLVRRRDLQRHLQTRHGASTIALESDSSD